MKLIELKALKNDKLLGRLLFELNLRGLKNIYIKTTDNVNIFDIIFSIIEFLDMNRDVFKKLKPDLYDKFIAICIDEVLETIGIDEEIEEEHIEKVIKLLKNNILVQKSTNWLIRKIKNGCSCSKSNQDFV